MKEPVRTARRGLLGLACCLSFASAGPAPAQEPDSVARVTVAQENFRASPGGARIAVLRRDATLTVGEERGRWREVTLDGWVPTAAVNRTQRGEFPLSIGRGGADLRAGPGEGAVIGQALTGLLLREVERRGEWVRVQRDGWMWAPSLELAARAPEPDPADPSPGGTPAVGARVLLATPGGDTLAALRDAAPLDVVGREGEWVRVRVEGWVPAAVADATGTPGAPRQGVTLEEMRADPERFRGQTIRWQVQFVAVQRADSLLTDLRPGEVYVLARDPGGEPGFVYIVVPPQLLGDVRALAPLQRITVVGRVRTGRSPLMGHPVLDLLEIQLEKS